MCPIHLIRGPFVGSLWKSHVFWTFDLVFYLQRLLLHAVVVVPGIPTRIPGVKKKIRRLSCPMLPSPQQYSLSLVQI